MTPLTTPPGSGRTPGGKGGGWLGETQDAPQDPGGNSNGLLVLLGGSRSGKSKLAGDLASGWDGPVTVIATAEPGDEEMAARIAAHRRERPGHWATVEEPVHIAVALREVGSADCVVLDCLTLWVSNLLALGHDIDNVRALATEAAAVAASRASPTIVVSNEVGSGIVPPTVLGRRYREILGEVNQVWAEAAGQVLLVVAGRVLEPHRLEQGWEHVP